MTDEPRTLIDALLAEQGQLTAVEKFAHAHENHQITEPRYRDFIPLTLPGPGQQFAFEVDLDKCSGCKACVTACHALNGLDEGEAWREVESLISNDWRQPFQQTITSACHHCVDPACMNGCPVLAYEKDPLTGIVQHFDDQCIGCQYCVMTCPYDVPKYSEARGIVRKCDMCSQRLAVQEAPACAQACPNEAIRITIVDQGTVTAEYRLEKGTLAVSPLTPALSPLRGEGELPRFLPASPDPAFTLPSTRYISKVPLPPTLVPADHAQVALQPSHWSLVFMLVLTQLGAGAFAVVSLVLSGLDNVASVRSLAVLGLSALVIGMGCSVAHLGKPFKAWRSFLGLRQSWLSREVVGFGMFLALASVTTVALWHFDSGLLAALTAIVSIAGVFCSAMVYESTPRPLWQRGRSVGRFFGTMALLGFVAAWLCGSKDSAVLLAVATVVKLAVEHRVLRRAWNSEADEAWPSEGDFSGWSLTQSAVLLRDRLGLVTRLRVLCAVVGGIVIPLLSLLSSQHLFIASISFVLCLTGELAERYTFFRAVVPPKFPRVHH